VSFGKAFCKVQKNLISTVVFKSETNLKAIHQFCFIIIKVAREGTTTKGAFPFYLASKNQRLQRFFVNFASPLRF